ncbi:MAG: urease accessory UreF family protein [Verrucomicrobiota bacterium]|nr:urease accessory UreF family protein [Verrucomicrobiota bacterium]
MSNLIWLASLLHTADSFYPTGGYAHSYGLEGLVHEGLVKDRESLRSFVLESLLPSLAAVDLPLAAHAWQAFGEPPDWSGVATLCELAVAVKPVKELRLACERVGRARLDLLSTLRPHPLSTAFAGYVREQRLQTPAPVLAALEARCIEAPLEAALAAVLYTTLSAVLSAAVKLLRMGQNACHTLLVESLTVGAATFTQATQRPIEEIGYFQPWWDVASARHETADGRLFIS